MKITLYVDWNNHWVLNRNQHEERLAEAADELFADSNCFAEWLEENCTMIDLFHAGGVEKEEIQERFRAYCEDNAENALSDDGEEYEEVNLDI